VYPNPTRETTPLAMRATVDFMHALHESVVIISAESVNVPHVAPDEQVRVDDMGYSDDGILHITARFGFQDDTNLPAALRRAVSQGLECPVDLDRASYFLSRITIGVTGAPTMPMWQKKLFVAIAHNAASAADYFGLPDDRTVVMSSRINV
jgi:KUP system potassium uptake protein